MKDYCTIEEKTAAWNISARYIQFLCRTQRIPGAIKRAGVWFIPDHVPVPTKYTKSNTANFKFVGTKDKIFSSAITLFMEKGVANVSFKDISQCAGVRPSTVYNHFKNKQAILDTIYDFYCHYYIHERLSLHDMETVIQKGSLINLLECISYEFKEDYRPKMTDITKIIFQRMGIDERAKEISRSLVIDEGVTYVENVLVSAVEKGRLAPFDTHLMAVFINTVRLFTLFYWMIDMPPESRVKILEDEKALYRYAAGLLTDLKPPLAAE